MKIEVKKLAIKFGDNDFYNTFIPLLQTLANAFKAKEKLNFTREELVKIINTLSYGHYLLFQNQFDYNEESLGEFCQRTIEWLQIEAEDILINEEVDEFTSENDWYNSECFIMDLTQHEPYIYSL